MVKKKTKLKLNEPKEVNLPLLWILMTENKKKPTVLAALCEFNYSSQTPPAFRQERKLVFVSGHNTPRPIRPMTGSPYPRDDDINPS